MSRLPIGQLAPGQIVRSNGILLEGLTIGDGLVVDGRTLRSSATGGAGTKGEKGEKGDKGDPGANGADGADGDPATVNGARITSLFILNETDGLYYEIRCRNIQPDNIPTLYLSDTGVP